MTTPAGYSLAPNGFYYFTDGSGPYNIDTLGNATLIGSGGSSGGGSGGGGIDLDPEVAKISKLVSGGGVAWISGLTFRVAAATYYIQGVLYASPQTDITLDAADVTNPRIDVFTLTTSSTAVDVTGTPASPAAKPEVNPDTQLEISFAYIAAGATVPTGSAATESIYAEATEWTRATNGNVTSNSASSPINGAVSILFANAAVGAYIRLTDSADLDLANSSNLVFTIKNAAAWPALSRLNIGWYTNGGALRGQLVSFKPGDYGSSSSSTDAQQIVIPLGVFGANGLAVRRLQMTLAGATVTTQFRLDDISLQAVTGLVVDESKLHWEGTWNANRLYTLNSVVRTGSPTGVYVAIRANTNANPATATTDWAELILDTSGGGGITSVNGYTGVVDLTATDVDAAFTADNQAWQSKKYLMRDGQWRDPLIIGTGLITVGAIATVTDDTKYNAWPQACRLRDGRLMIAYQKGDSHNEDNTGRSVGRIATENLDGTLTWGAEFEIYNHASLVSVPYGLSQISTGRIFVSVQQYDIAVTSYSAIMVYSDDDGATWSSPYSLNANSGLTAGALGTGKIVEMRDGTLRCLVEGSSVGLANRYCVVMTSIDEGATWDDPVTVHDYATDSVIAVESDLLLLDNNDLLAIHRTSGSASTHKASRSTDGGATWGATYNVFDGWGAPRFIQASTGTLVAVTRRNAGAAAIVFTSLDRGLTWDAGTTVDDTMNEMEYGCPVEMRDGRILVVYGYQPSAATTNSDIKVVPITETTIHVQSIPQIIKSAAYTFTLADANKHILHPSADATARIFTIPANSSVPYPIGTALTIVNQNGAGVITIAITTDTMRLAGAGTTGSRTLAANGIATLLKITATEWIASGTGLT
jgi:hypothetical protein